MKRGKGKDVESLVLWDVILVISLVSLILTGFWVFLDLISKNGKNYTVEVENGGKIGLYAVKIAWLTPVLEKYNLSLQDVLFYGVIVFLVLLIFFVIRLLIIHRHENRPAISAGFGINWSLANSR